MPYSHQQDNETFTHFMLGTNVGPTVGHHEEPLASEANPWTDG